MGDEYCVPPPRAGEKSPQDRRGEVEWDVAHEHVRIERMPQHIGVLDADRRQAASKCSNVSLVDVDRGESTPECHKTRREGAVTSADLEDRSLRTGDERDDALDGGGMDKKVLAEFVAAAGGTGTHERSKEEEEHPEGKRETSTRRGGLPGCKDIPEDGAEGARDLRRRQARRSRTSCRGAAHDAKIEPMSSSIRGRVNGGDAELLAAGAFVIRADDGIPY